MNDSLETYKAVRRDVVRLSIGYLLFRYIIMPIIALLGIGLLLGTVVFFNLHPIPACTPYNTNTICAR